MMTRLLFSILITFAAASAWAAPLPQTELPGKKWGFMGLLTSDKSYLVFTEDRVEDIQQCGGQELAFVYKMEAVGIDTFRLHALPTRGDENLCPVVFGPIFIDGLVVKFKAYSSDKGKLLIAHFQRPSDTLQTETEYREVK